MEKNRTFICVVFLLSLSWFVLPVSINAQNIRMQGAQQKLDTIDKMIVDRATTRIYYKMIYQPDPLKPSVKKTAETFLQIGHKVSRFMDYNSFRGDSVNDTSVKAGKQSGEYLPILMNLTRQVGFKPNILYDYPAGKNTFQQAVVILDVYEYTETPEKISWQLEKGDTLIQGYKCHKATCRYRGRDYVAWYADDVPIPFGPYVFGGLPGLIFKIDDTAHHYSFEINGLVNVVFYDPIYLRTGRRIIRSTRENTRKVYRNFCDNPAKAIMSTNLTIKMSEDQLAEIKPLPYNPIELE